jgi:hypothetical protein
VELQLLGQGAAQVGVVIDDQKGLSLHHGGTMHRFAARGQPPRDFDQQIGRPAGRRDPYRGRRPPNSAEPTRTLVAPWAMAAS